MSDYRRIKELEDKGHTLRARWDAGGDSTPVHVWIEGDDSDRYDDLLKSLRYIIIDKLHLPNAGEEYNYGAGTIFTRSDKVFLNYSFTYFRMYYPEFEYQEPVYDDEWNEIPRPELKPEIWPLEIRFPELVAYVKHIKRSNVHITGTLDNKGIYRVDHWLNVRHGDEWKFSYNDSHYIKSTVMAELNKRSHLFEKRMNDRPVHHLTFNNLLTEDLTLLAEVYVQYAEIMREGKNFSIQLF